jgi:hypothetical protein
MNPTIRVFISSKQSEFSSERAVLAHEIRSIPLLEPVLAEEWNPTGTNVHDVYLNDVLTSPIYVGLFGSIYSEPTYREYLAACENPYREKLLYLKKSETVDGKLQELIARFNDLHVPARFVTIADLLPVFSKHLMAALSRMISMLQMLGENKQTTQGQGGAMEKRWAKQKQHILTLGIPLANEARQQLIPRIEESLAFIQQNVHQHHEGVS